MYEEHFHLTTSPFNLGPDPKFLFLTDAVREALAVLSYGVTARKGFIQLTGEVGTGKTTLLNTFLRWLEERSAATAFIFNPHLEPDEFLELMLAHFGLERDWTTKSEMMLQFNRWLLERYRANQLAVVFVDEAQQLPAETLEELRLLTNLETPTHKLLQIILCGQPELETLLARSSLSQVRQRITLRCRTVPFTAEQTKEYITQRLRTAGAPDSEIFEPEAINLIQVCSGGIARIINTLCEQSMIEAYCDEAQTISATVVEKIGREMGLSVRPKGAEIRSVFPQHLGAEVGTGTVLGVHAVERKI